MTTRRRLNCSCTEEEEPVLQEAPRRQSPTRLTTISRNSPVRIPGPADVRGPPRQVPRQSPVRLEPRPETRRMPAPPSRQSPVRVAPRPTPTPARPRGLFGQTEPIRPRTDVPLTRRPVPTARQMGLYEEPEELPRARRNVTFEEEPPAFRGMRRAGADVEYNGPITREVPRGCPPCECPETRRVPVRTAAPPPPRSPPRLHRVLNNPLMPTQKPPNRREQMEELQREELAPERNIGWNWNWPWNRRGTSELSMTSRDDDVWFEDEDWFEDENEEVIPSMTRRRKSFNSKSPPTRTYSRSGDKHPNKHYFCGRAGGSGTRSYPVDTTDDIWRSLARRKNASNPEGVYGCACHRARELGVEERWPSCQAYLKDYKGRPVRKRTSSK